MSIKITGGVKVPQGKFSVYSSPSAGPQLWTWGKGTSGQLGQGNFDSTSSPVQVEEELNWASVSADDAHALAIKTDGTLWAFGAGANGRLGTNSSTTATLPTQVGTDWSVAHAGRYSSIAIKTDGSLWAWGFNSEGNIGDGTTIQRSSPVQIGSFTDWTDASIKGRSTHAIRSGYLFGWGQGQSYKIGDGTQTNRSSPVPIGNLSTWAKVDSAISRTFAIKTDGSLWSWGVNGTGELGHGLGGYFLVPSPVQIPGSTDWAEIGSGGSHSIGIKTNGTLWAWGGAFDGKLGLNDVSINRSSPTQVGNLTNWSKIYVGLYSTIALKTDGTLWAWGQNTFGQLGQGDLIKRSSPVQIGTDTNWTSLGGTGGTGIAIKTTV